jgi:hypothetical protein
MNLLRSTSRGFGNYHRISLMLVAPLQNLSLVLCLIWAIHTTLLHDFPAVSLHPLAQRDMNVIAIYLASAGEPALIPYIGILSGSIRMAAKQGEFTFLGPIARAMPNANTGTYAAYKPLDAKAEVLGKTVVTKLNALITNDDYTRALDRDDCTAHVMVIGAVNNALTPSVLQTQVKKSGIRT